MYFITQLTLTQNPAKKIQMINSKIQIKMIHLANTLINYNCLKSQIVLMKSMIFLVTFQSFKGEVSIKKIFQ